MVYDHSSILREVDNHLLLVPLGRAAATRRPRVASVLPDSAAALVGLDLTYVVVAESGRRAAVDLLVRRRIVARHRPSRESLVL